MSTQNLTIHKTDDSRQDVLRQGEHFRKGQASIYFSPAESLYTQWPVPTCIIADGPYGLSGFPGDMHTSDTLLEWYRPHVEAWSLRSTPETTLWFWNSELGWATVHPLLLRNGWEYRCCHIWDKGMAHAAGNSNTQTLRKLPVVTEVCVQYVKAPRFTANSLQMTMQEWLRYEWQRTALPLNLSNKACGVANAATRKYLTADHLWYYPPPEAFQRMADYANRRGKPNGRPYFSRDGKRAISTEEWSHLRAKFNCPMGLTNVWAHPQVSGSERVNGTRQRMKWKYRSLHGSQKPLKLIDICITTSTDEGDVVWEPFGGLCPAAVCSMQTKRQSVSAEIISEFYLAAVQRLNSIHV